MGVFSAFFLYWLLSYFFPAKEALLEASIHDDAEVIECVQYANDGIKLEPVGGESSGMASSKTKKKTAEAHVGGI